MTVEIISGLIGDLGNTVGRYNQSTTKAAFIDLNGDGRPDYVRSLYLEESGTYWEVFWNRGSKLVKGELWKVPSVQVKRRVVGGAVWEDWLVAAVRADTAVGWYDQGPGGSSGVEKFAAATVADMNGDNLPDLVIHRTLQGPLVYLNTGYGFDDNPRGNWSYAGGQSNWVNINHQLTISETSETYTYSALADVTGDGIVDWLYVEDPGFGRAGQITRIMMAENTGDGFLSPVDYQQLWGDLPLFRTHTSKGVTRSHTGIYDLEGDGRPELYSYSIVPDEFGRGIVTLSSSGEAESTGRLWRVSVEEGVLEAIYKPSVSGVGPDLGAFQTVGLPAYDMSNYAPLGRGGRIVLASTDWRPKLAPSERTYFAYGGAQYSEARRSPAGFAAVQILDVDTGLLRYLESATGSDFLRNIPTRVRAKAVGVGYEEDSIRTPVERHPFGPDSGFGVVVQASDPNRAKIEIYQYGDEGELTSLEVYLDSTKIQGKIATWATMYTSTHSVQGLSEVLTKDAIGRVVDGKRYYYDCFELPPDFNRTCSLGTIIVGEFERQSVLHDADTDDWWEENIFYDSSTKTPKKIVGPNGAFVELEFGIGGLYRDLTSMIDEADNVTDFTYDEPYGWVTTVSRQALAGSGFAPHVLQNTRDGFGRVVRLEETTNDTDPYSSQLTLRKVLSYENDSFEGGEPKVTKQWWPGSAAEEYSEGAWKTIQFHDGNGGVLLARQSDNSGQDYTETWKTWWPGSRPASVHGPTTSPWSGAGDTYVPVPGGLPGEEYEYDGVGRLSRKLDRTGSVTESHSFTIGPESVHTIVDGNGDSRATILDGLGRVVAAKVMSPVGDCHENRYWTDSESQILEIRKGVCNAAGNYPVGVASYEYYSSGEIRHSRIGSPSVLGEYEDAWNYYYIWGQLDHKINGNGCIVRYDWESAGRPTKITHEDCREPNSVEAMDLQYTYEDSSKPYAMGSPTLIEATNGAGDAWSKSLDYARNGGSLSVVWAMDGITQSTVHNYDSRNLVVEKDYSGMLNGQTNFGYDSSNRLAVVAWTKPGGGQIELAELDYDAWRLPKEIRSLQSGTMAEVVRDIEGRTERTRFWDSLGGLAAVDQVVTDRDGAGRIESRTNFEENYSIEYKYDFRGRLLEALYRRSGEENGLINATYGEHLSGIPERIFGGIPWANHKVDRTIFTNPLNERIEAVEHSNSNGSPMGYVSNGIESYSFDAMGSVVASSLVGTTDRDYSTYFDTYGRGTRIESAIGEPLTIVYGTGSNILKTIEGDGVRYQFGDVSMSSDGVARVAIGAGHGALKVSEGGGGSLAREDCRRQRFRLL